MAKHESIEDALDALDAGTGMVRASTKRGTVAVDVVAVDRLGVKVREVSVTRDDPFDLVLECAALPERVRSLPHRVIPVEVDPRLGGGVLRSAPQEMRKSDFYQIDMDTDRNIGVRRFKVNDHGDREQIEYTLTRERLEDLIDELS